MGRDQFVDGEVRGGDGVRRSGFGPRSGDVDRGNRKGVSRAGAQAGDRRRGRRCRHRGRRLGVRADVGLDAVAADRGPTVAGRRGPADGRLPRSRRRADPRRRARRVRGRRGDGVGGGRFRAASHHVHGGDFEGVGRASGEAGDRRRGRRRRHRGRRLGGRADVGRDAVAADRAAAVARRRGPVDCRLQRPGGGADSGRGAGRIRDGRGHRVRGSGLGAAAFFVYRGDGEGVGGAAGQTGDRFRAGRRGDRGRRLGSRADVRGDPIGGCCAAGRRRSPIDCRLQGSRRRADVRHRTRRLGRPGGVEDDVDPVVLGMVGVLREGAALGVLVEPIPVAVVGQYVQRRAVEVVGPHRGRPIDRELRRRVVPFRGEVGGDVGRVRLDRDRARE